MSANPTSDQLTDLIRRQAAASAELIHCTTFREIVAVIAKHILARPRQFVTLNLSEFDEAGTLTGLRIMASANRQNSFDAQNYIEVSKDNVGSLSEDRPVVIQQVDTEPTFSPTFRAWLAGFNIHSLAYFPLRHTGRSFGSIAINDTQQSLVLDEVELDLFQVLADQIGGIIHARMLLDEARATADQLGQQVSRLNRINEFATRLAADADEKILLDHATEALVKTLGIDHSGIVLVAPGERYGTVASEYPKQGAEGLQIDTIDNPLWDELRRNEFQPLVVQNAETDTRIEPSTKEAFRTLGIKAIGLLPIVFREQVIGGIGLDIYTPNRPITSDMLDAAMIITAQLNAGLQNLRLLNEVQAGAVRLGVKVTTLQQLNELEARISVATDEQTLMNEAIKGLYDLLQVDHAGLVLLDESKTIATLASEYPDGGLVGKVQFPVVGNPLFEFINDMDRDPVIIHDLETDPRLNEINRAPLREIGVRSLMILPLIVQDKVIGSVGVDVYTDEKRFNPDVVETGRTIASQMAIALQNIRLLNEARHRARQFQHITAFSEAAQADLDVGIILRLMLTKTDQMLTNDQISINLYDMRAHHLRVVAQRLDGSNQIGMATGEIIPITGHVERVWLSQEPLYFPDLRQTPHEMYPGITLRSWLIVPIIARGMRRGIISLGSTQPSAYNETDIAFFKQLVNQFALILDNLEAYQQSTRIARNEALVNEISTRLQRELDLQGMLNLAATELGKAIGARRARVRLGTEANEVEAGDE